MRGPLLSVEAPPAPRRLGTGGFCSPLPEGIRGFWVSQVTVDERVRDGSRRKEFVDGGSLKNYHGNGFPVKSESFSGSLFKSRGKWEPATK